MTMPNTEARSPQDGGTAREQIREVKDQVVGQARNTLQQARERASSSLGESKSQVADQLGTIAQALRRTTEHLRAEDQQRIAGLTDTVARQVDQVANYLRNKDASAMKADLENLAKRQPAIVIGGALVLGLIGARFLKSSKRGPARASDGHGGRFGNRGYNPLPGTERGYRGGGYAGA